MVSGAIEIASVELARMREVSVGRRSAQQRALRLRREQRRSAPRAGAPVDAENRALNLHIVKECVNEVVVVRSP